MNVAVEQAGACRKKVRVNFSADEVDAEYGKMVAAFAQSAKLPGFRPGKAPLAMVEKRFAKQIREELRDQLLPRGYREALAQEKIDVVTILDVEEAKPEPHAPFQFTVTVDVPPVFDLPEYKGLPLTKEVKDVADADIDQALDMMREQYAEYEDAEGRPVQAEDLVKVDYTATCEGQPLEAIAPNAKGLEKREDFWVSTGSYSFLPEFKEGLLGHAIGDTFDLPVSFPEGFAAKELAGKSAVYRVTVKAIRGKKLPAVDAAFCQKFQAASEDELRQRIREDLVRRNEEQETQRLKNEIARMFLAGTSMDLPETEVQRETQSVIYDIVRRQTQQGTKADDLEKNKDQLFQAASQNATDTLKLRYILHTIGEKEGLRVTKEDLAAHLEGMAARYGMPADALRAELEKRKAIDDIEVRLRQDKVMDFILSEARLA